jgi:chemotaxis protein CheX
MNVKVLNPFVEAAYEIIMAETKAEVQRGELSLDRGTFFTDEVTVIISVVGAIDGTVFFSMAESTALKIASILMDDSFEDFGNLAQSGIAELGNVITGRASMKLSDAGYETTISTPSLIIGKGATISTLDYSRIIVPLGTVAGQVFIHLALRESNAHGMKTSEIPIPKPFEV